MMLVAVMVMMLVVTVLIVLRWTARSEAQSVDFRDPRRVLRARSTHRVNCSSEPSCKPAYTLQLQAL
jgi:hypothetical protein